MGDFERINPEKMTTIELDANAADIIHRIMKREKLESASDAIRTWDNQCMLQSVVIHRQDNEIDKLKCEIARLKKQMEEKDKPEISGLD